jgi:sn-glycerol 3-phosphate transport system substrate-binding protein
MTVSRRGLGELEAGFFAQHPNAKVSYDQLAVARPWPWAPELFRLQREAVQPRLESAVLERREAARVLDEARRQVADWPRATRAR